MKTNNNLPKRLLPVLILVIAIYSNNVSAQGGVGIGTTLPHSSAQLDIVAENKGLLIPRITLTGSDDATTIPNPPYSMVVFNNSTDLVAFPQGPGYYYQSSDDQQKVDWIKLITMNDIANLNQGSNGWLLTGNANIDPANFIGTTTNQNLVFKRNNDEVVQFYTGGAVVFTGNKTTGVVPANVMGAGNRFMWIPKQGAARAGIVDGNQWDPVNIADYSFAAGRNTIASQPGATAFGLSTEAKGPRAFAAGYLSSASKTDATALGYNTDASGNVSTAMGYSTVASGFAATAMGRLTIASGFYATALGRETLAQGDTSTAMGFKSIASGKVATAMGLSTTASGFAATAMGRETIASGDSSTAMGSKTVASGRASTASGGQTVAKGDYSFAAGFNSKANTDYSVAIGSGHVTNGFASIAIGTGDTTEASAKYGVTLGVANKAFEDYAFAMGYKSVALRPYSYAIGSTDSAKGDYSYAIGDKNVAIGISSIAMGYRNTAIGDRSIAMGSTDTTHGFASFAGGHLSSAKGDFSFAFGQGAVAQCTGSVSLGTYPEILPNDCNNSCFANQAWAVGGAILFQVGNGTSADKRSDALRMDRSGNMYIAGKTLGNGGFSCTSDIRLKEDIEPLKDALTKIDHIQPISYYFKDKEKFPSGRQVGFSAQEIQKEYPELVTGSTNGGGYLAVNYPQMTAVAIQAIKEQQEIIKAEQDKNAQQQLIIEKLNIKNADLEERIKKLEAIILSTAHQ